MLLNFKGSTATENLFFFRIGQYSYNSLFYKNTGHLLTKQAEIFIHNLNNNEDIAKLF